MCVCVSLEMSDGFLYMHVAVALVRCVITSKLNWKLHHGD